MSKLDTLQESARARLIGRVKASGARSAAS
jgi:hypothetical protein